MNVFNSIRVQAKADVSQMVRWLRLDQVPFEPLQSQQFAYSQLNCYRSSSLCHTNDSFP